MESLATVGLLQPEQLLMPPRQSTNDGQGTVHGAALRAGQDSRRFRPRHVVQPDDLDGDVQRPAELARHPPALPVLVLSLSHRPAVLAQRGPVPPRPGRDAASARSAASRTGPGSDGAGGPQHGRAGRAAANPGERAATIGIWRAAIPWEQVKADPEVRQKLGETFYFHPNPSIRRVVTIATPYRRQHFFQPDDSISPGQADSPARVDRQYPAATLPRQPRDALPGIALEDRVRASTRYRPARRSSP